jgi:hypothetical protein
MIYVLILVIAGHAVHTQEFNSQASCEEAARIYTDAYLIRWDYKAMCVKK